MWRELPKTMRTRKPQLDSIDLEAERQGNATGFMRRNEIGPKTLGRRISKESRKADGYAKTAEVRATRHIVIETARIVAERTTQPLKLRQLA